MSPLQILQARAIPRIGALISRPKTSRARSDISILAFGCALLATPNLPGTKLPPEIVETNQFLMDRLGIVVPEGVTEFAMRMCGPEY